MTDRPIPAPRKWKDAVWRRLDQHFAATEDVDTLGAHLSDVTAELDRLRGRAGALERGLEAHIDSVTARIGQLDSTASLEQLQEINSRLEILDGQIKELRQRLDAGLERMSRQALVDAQNVMAISVLLTPDRPLPPVGGWALAPDSARYLVETVLERRPSQVIECGSGSSTVLIAMALERNGHGYLTTLEHDIEYLRLTQQMLDAYGLGERVDLIHAPLQPVDVDQLSISWYRLPDWGPGEKSFDLLLVDGPPSTDNFDRYPALPLVHPYLSERALVLVDDANRPHEKQMVEMWTQAFPEFTVERLPHTKGTVVLRRGPAAQVS